MQIRDVERLVPFALRRGLIEDNGLRERRPSGIPWPGPRPRFHACHFTPRTTSPIPRQVSTQLCSSGSFGSFGGTGANPTAARRGWARASGLHPVTRRDGGSWTAAGRRQVPRRGNL